MSLNSWATSCELNIDSPNYFQKSLGQISFSSFDNIQIWIDRSMGDISSKFNFNDNYEIITNNGSYYFRLNGIAYNPTGTNQTYIYNIAWDHKRVPPISGTYIVNEYKTESNPIFGRSLATIGDSITHWEYGRYMRCLMRDAGLAYDFTGEFTDIFGYGHEGAGGNNTQHILNRMDSIVVADTYFILIGTNDRIAPLQTVSNIESIAQQLKMKNPYSKVYISTLLPRKDIYNSNVQEINELLLNSPDFCDNCIVIDVGGRFEALPNWPSLLMDSIHLNYNGYVALAAIINSLIE